MKPLIIGSVALEYHLNKLDIKSNLVPIDLDIIVWNKDDLDSFINQIKKESFKFTVLSESKIEKFSIITTCILADNKHIEISYPTTEDCSTYELLLSSVYYGDSVEKFHVKCAIAPINVLYDIKMSHRYLRNSPHFLKTMNTIKNLKILGATTYDHKWVKIRESETYDYSHPKLNVNKKDFFNSNFSYVYDHDSIHEAVKHLERPAYTYYMDDDSEVNCSKDKFLKSALCIRLYGVLEETYVLALERSQIPNNFNVDPKESFLIALEKVCTSITSGWFREFAYDNYNIIVKLYDSNYVNKFKYALEAGNIKKLENKLN